MGRRNKESRARILAGTEMSRSITNSGPTKPSKGKLIPSPIGIVVTEMKGLRQKNSANRRERRHWKGEEDERLILRTGNPEQS